MRGIGATGILALVVAGLIGYAYYDYREGEKKSAESAEKEKIVGVDPAQVNLLSLVKPDETVVLAREGSEWKMTAPLTDEVESEAATSYLDSVTNEKGSEIERPKDGFNWAEYNLDAPAAKFELTKADGSKVEFSVSRLAAFDGRYYVRKGDKLFIGTSAWGGFASKRASQLRSKKVLRQAGQVEALTLEFDNKWVKEQISLSRGTEGGWKMPGSSFSISPSSVEKYIDQIKELRALDYLPAAAKIDKPAAKIKLKFAQAEKPNPEWTLWVAAEKDGSALSGSTNVKEGFKLSQYDAGQLMKTKSDFRDRHEPFKLAVDQIKEIQIQSKGTRRIIRKDGSEWKVQDLKDGEELATANLEQMLTQVGALEAKEFYRPGTGIGEVTEKVGFRDSAGKLLLELSLAGEVSAGKDNESRMRFVKSNLTKDVLGILSADAESVAFSSVVRNKVVPPAEATQKQ